MSNNIFDSFSSFGSLNSIDLSKILKLNDITPAIQNHLAKVYRFVRYVSDLTE